MIATLAVCVLVAYLLGYLAAHRRIEQLTTQRNQALVKWWQAEDELATDAGHIDQAVKLANSPRHDAIVDLIARNEAARFDADSVDWGQP